MASNPNIHPSLLTRKILHVDMDAFYAAVEIRENPALRDKPIVVGGKPDSRGVVCTANYIARKFGIKSAMPCSQAYRLCPEAMFIRPNFPLYKAASEHIFRIFREFTDRVEGLSLDEAYLDVTDHARESTATKIAQKLKEDIQAKTQLTASVGVAPNKMLAKIASDINKPNGIAVIQPAEAVPFMQKLAIRRIHGIGPVTASKLLELGIETCSDALSLRDRIRTHAPGLYPWILERCMGIDERPVETDWLRKSIGSEETFAADVADAEELQRILRELVNDLVRRMDHARAISNRFTLKIKYADFITRTHARTLPVHSRNEQILRETFLDALGRERDLKKKIRLMGVSATNLSFIEEGEPYLEQPLLKF